MLRILDDIIIGVRDMIKVEVLERDGEDHRLYILFTNQNSTLISLNQTIEEKKLHAFSPLPRVVPYF
jgi:hypothetical protein